MRDCIKLSFRPFQLGQKVWLEGRNLSIPYNKKIMTKHEGPLCIVEKLSPVTYQSKIWNISDSFHTVLLTLYKENNIYSPNYIQPSSDLIDSEEEWEVEHIIKDRQCCAHSLNSQKIESNGLYYINKTNIICMNFYLYDNYALIYLLLVIDFKDI